MRDDRVDVRAANQAWEAVMTAHARLVSRFASEGVFTEVSMREYDVLYTLAKIGEPTRLSDLKSGVLLSQPALSRLVDRLIGRGLLQRTSDPDDRRAVRISLTGEGKQLQKKVGRVHAQSVARELRAALDAEEISEIGRIAAKLATGSQRSSRHG